MALVGDTKNVENGNSYERKKSGRILRTWKRVKSTFKRSWKFTKSQVSQS